MSGYSPAMIEQAISMALTIAHHTGSQGFAWDDLVEAVTTLDAGTAIGSEYIPMERRAVAIHEAGHAVAGHVYLTGRESTRLTIKKRGDQGVGGHHWMIEKEERLFSFQHEMFHDIVWGLGAMAAERVVYGENSNGVGGDVAGVTARAALMVGRAAMGPQPFHVTPRRTARPRSRRARQVLDRFEKIGLQIMSRAGGGGPFDADPIAGVLGDPTKRTVAAQILGQAYVTAHNLAIANRAGIETIADALEDKREIMGDELLRLLESARDHDPRARPRRRVGLAAARVLGGDRTRPAAARAAAPSGGDGVSEAHRRAARRGAARVHRGRAGPADRPSRAEPSRTDRARSAAYRSRFAIVYAALALVAGLGVGAFVVLAVAPGSGARRRSGRRGSRRAATRPRRSRSPTGSRKRYRLKSGQQLVGGARRAHRRSSGAERRRAREHDRDPPRHVDREEGRERDRHHLGGQAASSTSSAASAQHCSIKGGTPSEARHALLRREALELALYTFKYVDGIDSVSVFLPPRPDGQAAGDVGLPQEERRQGRAAASRSSSRSAPKTPTIGTMTKRELALVNRITEPRLYTYEYQQAQDGSAVLDLRPGRPRRLARRATARPTRRTPGCACSPKSRLDRLDWWPTPGPHRARVAAL